MDARFHAIVASKRYTLKSGQTKTLKVKLPKGVRLAIKLVR